MPAQEQPQKKITDLSDNDLKALAFDESEKIGQAQQNIQTIRQELARRRQMNPVGATSVKPPKNKENPNG